MDIFLAKLSTFGNALPGDITQGLIWGIMAIGVFITYKILDFADLTVDGTLGLGGVVAVVLISNGVPVPVAMLIAFLAGCAAGLCTALLNTMLGIPGILAGILTQLALYSVYLDINGKANAPVSVDKFSLVISSRYVTAGNEVVDIIRTVGTALLFVVLIIAALYWFFGTEYGMAIRATGCNSSMSKAEGINTKRTTIIALVLSNGMVGLAGALLAQYQGFADVNMGRGAIVIGLAAVIIGMVLGEVILRKHFNFIGKLAFTALGAIIYFVVLRIVLLLGLSTDNTKMFSALIVAIFLAVPYLQKTSKTSFRRAAKRSAGAAASAAAAESEHFGQVMQNSVTGKKEDK